MKVRRRKIDYKTLTRLEAVEAYVLAGETRVAAKEIVADGNADIEPLACITVLDRARRTYKQAILSWLEYVTLHQVLGVIESWESRLQSHSRKSPDLCKIGANIADIELPAKEGPLSQGDFKEGDFCFKWPSRTLVVALRPRSDNDDLCTGMDLHYHVVDTHVNWI